MGQLSGGVVDLGRRHRLSVLTRPELRMLSWWMRGARGREVPAPIMVALCAVPTTLGSIYAVGHGAGQIIGGLLELAGVGVASVFADSPPNTTATLLWGIAFYGPWFLAMGSACSGPR